MARSTTRKIHRDGTFHGSAAETGMRYPAGMRYPWKTPIHRDFGPTYVTPPPRKSAARSSARSKIDPHQEHDLPLGEHGGRQ